MKNFYSCLIILTLFSSCTTTDHMISDEIQLTQSKRTATDLPSYGANPYDNAGRLYDELFDTYYNGSERDTSLESIMNDVHTIADTNINFTSQFNSNCPLLSAERIEYLASRNTSHIVGIIAASNLSATAKTSFSNFLIGVTAQYAIENDCVTMYNNIVNYEEKVISSNVLTEEDKQIVLTTTSIIRYTTYRAKKKPKKNTDPDWLILVTHAFAAEEGAEEDTSEAILCALITGIVSNK